MVASDTHTSSFGFLFVLVRISIHRLFGKRPSSMQATSPGKRSTSFLPRRLSGVFGIPFSPAFPDRAYPDRCSCVSTKRQSDVRVNHGPGAAASSGSIGGATPYRRRGGQQLDSNVRTRVKMSAVRGQSITHLVSVPMTSVPRSGHSSRDHHRYVGCVDEGLFQDAQSCSLVRTVCLAGIVFAEYIPCVFCFREGIHSLL